MNRTVTIALLVLVAVVATFALFSTRPGDTDLDAGLGTEATPEPGITQLQEDRVDAPALAPAPGVADDAGPADSNTRAAASAATDEAVESLERSGEPVQGALEEIRTIVQEAGVVGAADEFREDPQNDEAALRAHAIGTEEASDPAFVARTLEPESFEAERVVALIDASPRLTDEQRLELSIAIQAVAEVPEARDRVLAQLEAILQPDG